MTELTTRDFTLAEEPFALFGEWLDAAQQSEPNDPIAMALATVGLDGLPNVRMVLMKGYDERGFVFYTNVESTKGRELAAHMKVAALFHWKSLRKQVRIRGPVEPVTDAEADAYFASRPRVSRIGSWASQQSRPLPSRAFFEAEVERYDRLYPGDDIPRPPQWKGFRIRPLSIEFWSDRPFRLHDRLVFSRAAPGHDWDKTRLYP